MEDWLFAADGLDGRLISQPIAAAAHLAHHDPSLEGATLVLCDLGTSAMRIDVCRVEAGGIDLLRHEETPAGAPLRAFDVDAALAAYAIRRGDGIRTLGTNVRLLRRAIAQARGRLDPEVEAELWAGRAALFGRERYVKAEDYELTYDDAAAATGSLIAACDELAGTVRGTQPELIEGGPWRVALLGGGALFPPLRQAVLRGLGTGETDARLVDIDREAGLRAAACGAALVAGREVDPGDRYLRTRCSSRHVR